MKEKKINFEENLARLEEITAKLDSGSASLDEMLGLFEEGIGLTKECMKKLDETEQRVSVLMKNAAGETVEAPFTADQL